jgi:hypothetical protein
MMLTLYGILILRIPLQPWDHIAFALPIKKAPPDHRFSGDCPIVPPPATLCRYCQNRLNIVRNRLLLFWTICIHQVCYAPAMRIYLRLSVRARGNPIFVIKTALLQLCDSVHLGPARVKRFRSSKSHRIQCF